MFSLPHFRARAGSRLRPSRAAILLLLFAVTVGRAAPVELFPRLITFPATAGKPLFADVDGDGRSDLLVIDAVEKKLFNYHQRPDGFGSAPDQTISLPPQTAWVAACDVDAHLGLELLFSTANGLVYSRQNGGLFESEQHTLIKAGQVFTNDDSPILVSLPTNKIGTNVLIPLISATEAVRYHRNNAYEWSSETPLPLAEIHAAWEVNDLGSQWTLGPNPAHRLSVRQSFQIKPDPAQGEDLKNEAIRKIVEDMNNSTALGVPRTNRMDFDGDGQEDLVLWQCSGKLDCKTDIYVFLRGADKKLPGRPTQVLHCRGFPIPTGSTFAPSPMIDMNGDGACELVLLELKSNFISASGAIETALSHGLDWALTVRSFHRGLFSRSQDISFPVTGILPTGPLDEWPIFILGDFNGDHRPDLVFRRTDTHWNIFLSTTDERAFAPQPALIFDAPVNGYVEILDLNGDGLSDIIWHEPDENRLSIFMSPSQPARGKKP
jgi:hypothetical protein